jgi:hypothetical protein
MSRGLLNQRTSLRTMSRPNMERAVTRLRSELAVLISACPKDADSRTAELDANKLLDKIRNLWYGSEL